MRTSWLTWNIGSVPHNAQNEKNTASGFQRFPRPYTMKYIGPPWISPRLSGPRYWIDSEQVKNLVAIPTKAQTHIQKIAPGPPVWIATATPAMFAIPIVPARALLSA